MRKLKFDDKTIPLIEHRFLNLRSIGLDIFGLKIMSVIYVVDYIIRSRSESFCAQRLKTETKSRPATGRSTKRPTPNDI
jgi:hypothetical protein